MPSTPRPEPTPDHFPAPLPDRLLGEMIRCGPLFLCLDYDGTLAEIVPDPARARPLGGMREVLERLARARGRVRVAIISGRDLKTLENLLGGWIEGLLAAGSHGLEFMENGKRMTAAGVAECEPELERVRRWLRLNVPPAGGLVVEDKRESVALHYRNAPPDQASQVRDRFERFLALETPNLRAQHGKMVIEALPRFAGKGNAVREFARRVGNTFTPVYFGDDLTDEDAFIAVQETGVGVLVGVERRSAATYRVDSPRAVFNCLRELAQVVEEL